MLASRADPVSAYDLADPPSLWLMLVYCPLAHADKVIIIKVETAKGTISGFRSFPLKNGYRRNEPNENNK